MATLLILEIYLMTISMYVIPIHQRYRRTDWRHYDNTALCAASRGKTRLWQPSCELWHSLH